MENSNKISKSLLFITLLSFCIYSGSYLTKLFLLNQFFDAETMELKAMYANQNLNLVLQSLLPVFSTSLISVIVFIVFFVIYLTYSKTNLKNFGWLLIISITVLITAPFELFLIIKYDLAIIQNLSNTVFDSNVILVLMKERITEFGPFPLILLFSNILIIFLTTFKPLQKTQ